MLVGSGTDLPGDLCVGVHGASVAARHARRKLALSLEPDLDEVGGVGDGDSDGA